MSYALFEEAGKLLAGRVLSEAEASLQVELDSGKRAKVKSAHVLLRFSQPAPAELMNGAQAVATQIDPSLAWEFAPEGEFGFADLAREYFDPKADAVHLVAALLSLHEAPHYFRRAGRGVFKKAPQEVVQAALAAIERRQQVAAQIEAWTLDLVDGRCPQAVREQLYRILFKPDKQDPEYKAVVEASRRSGRAPLALLQAAGAITSAYQFHWRRFLFDAFPKGTAHAAWPVPAIQETLARAPTPAFSIDDSATTEIDDALSVQGLGTGFVTFGIHIAAPALAIAPDSPLDRAARERLSTVYMPGNKLTMLPDAVVRAYTLTQGQDCPAVSLYVRFDETTLELLGTETRLESVPIAANLRHDELDAHVTEDALSGNSVADYPFAAELAFAWRLARHLKAQREVVRGKPENFNRPDYNFRLTKVGDDVDPTGDETVTIDVRRRGAPLDLIVAEAMILANCRWGALLAECGLPGLYRSQASLAPGVKVRMGTKPMPHAGMGVPQYSWATSPLRRYVDLVNQWQIVACVRHGPTAALAAPFKPRDATLFSILSAFDAAYTSYNDFQSGIERFWTLRWLQQHETTELDATTLKDGLVRADNLPLVFRALGCDALPRATPVRVRLTGLDLLTLEVHASLIEQRVAPEEQAAAGSPDPAADDDDGDAASASSTGLTLALDLADPTAAEPAGAAAAG